MNDVLGKGRIQKKKQPVSGPIKGAAGGPKIYKSSNEAPSAAASASQRFQQHTPSGQQQQPQLTPQQLQQLQQFQIMMQAQLQAAAGTGPITPEQQQQQLAQ